MKSASTPKHLKFAVLAVDTVVFTIEDDTLKVLLISVNRPPHFNGTPAMPGGIITPQETAEEAAQRILREKGGLVQVYLEQLYTFSTVGRDPRGRVVSVGYLGLVSKEKARTLAGGTGAWWEPVVTARHLAYDHDEILALALKRLQGKLVYTNIAFSLLPHEFTLTELQKLYEIILKKPLDKRNFRKKILDIGLVVTTGKERRGGASRPAALYRFAKHTPQEVGVL